MRLQIQKQFKWKVLETVKYGLINPYWTLPEKCPNTDVFYVSCFPAFSRIRENKDQQNSLFWHFSHSGRGNQCFVRYHSHVVKLSKFDNCWTG